MDNKLRNHALIAGGIVVGLLLSAWFLSIGLKGVVADGPMVGGNTPVPTQQDPTFGAVASPDVISPYLTVGGVRHWFGRKDTLTQASSTACAIQSPAATSTLVHGSVRLTLASSSASIIQLAKSSQLTGTSTPIGSPLFIAASGQGTLVASSTIADAQAGDFVFAPLQWFTVGIAGADSGDPTPEGMAPIGSCNAKWIELY